MVGNFDRNNRHMTSRLVNKFLKLEKEMPGFIDKIQNPDATGETADDNNLYFIDFPVNTQGNLLEDEDKTGLCRIFQEIRTNKANPFRGSYEYIDSNEFTNISRLEDAGFVPDEHLSKGKRPRVEEAGEGAGGSAMVVDALAQPVSVEFLNAKTRELELLKGNYSALERSAFDIRSTAQAAIDELTTAGAGKDAAIATLTASNASKDARILELAAAAANLETKCGEVDRLRRLVEKTKDELAARDAEILELRKPSTAGPASAKDQHQGLLQFKAGAGKYDAAMKQVRDLEAKLKTATDEMNRLYGEVNRLEQEVERAAPPASSGGGGPGWADQFVLSNAKWVVVVSPCLFLFFFQLPPLTTAAHAGSTWRSSRGSPCTSRRRRCCAWRRSCWTRRWRSSR